MKVAKLSISSILALRQLSYTNNCQPEGGLFEKTPQVVILISTSSTLRIIVLIQAADALQL